MNANEAVRVLREYDRGLKNLVQALQSNRNRRELVALIQELANQDIARILVLDLPRNWQTDDEELCQRVIATLEDIRKGAELAATFVGREGVPAALDPLTAGICLNIKSCLGRTSNVSSAGEENGAQGANRKWWQLWKR